MGLAAGIPVEGIRRDAFVEALSPIVWSTFRKQFF
jgi:hypothetical protein